MASAEGTDSEQWLHRCTGGMKTSVVHASRLSCSSCFAEKLQSWYSTSAFTFSLQCSLHVLHWSISLYSLPLIMPCLAMALYLRRYWDKTWPTSLSPKTVSQSVHHLQWKTTQVHSATQQYLVYVKLFLTTWRQGRSLYSPLAILYNSETRQKLFSKAWRRSGLTLHKLVTKIWTHWLSKTEGGVHLHTVKLHEKWHFMRFSNGVVGSVLQHRTVAL